VPRLYATPARRAADDPAHNDAVLAAEAEAGIVHGPEVDRSRRTGDHDDDRRLQRLRDGVRSLRSGGTPLAEHALFVAGGILVPLGLISIIVGWYGAAHTPNLFEQLPYLISGGLFGLGLVVLGSFLYFAHWITQLVKEQRSQSTAVLAALRHLEEVMAAAPATADADADTPGRGLSDRATIAP
jgi:hypothetical protein